MAETPVAPPPDTDQQNCSENLLELGKQWRVDPGAREPAAETTDRTEPDKPKQKQNWKGLPWKYDEAERLLDDAIAALAEFDPKQVITCYADGEIQDALARCAFVLKACERTSLDQVTPEIKADINRFIETFLYLLTRPDVLLTREQVGILMTGHHVLANLVAISDFKTTDPQLALLGAQQRNFRKVVLLYSVMNRQWVDPRQFFDADYQLASMWYATYALGVVSMADKQVWENLQRHVMYIDDRLEVPDHRINGIFFGATYINADQARKLKARYNADIRRQMADKAPRLKPKPGRIAIASAKWRLGTAVHRSIAPLVDTLKDKYHMTLIQMGQWAEQSDREGFDAVRTVRHEEKRFDCKEITETDFELIFYPDIGMSTESIWMANMRLAPIQVTGYGHPDTTADALIDYFIGGAEVEMPGKAQEFYSERLVLIPGLGAVPVYPEYDPTFPPRSNDEIMVNIPWGTTKNNYPMMMRLKAIQQRANKPVFLRFFPGSGAARYSALPIFLRQLGSLFGNTAKVYSERNYVDYMAELEQAHLMLDSFPFGGYNTVVDALHLAKPVVAQEGERFYNRASSALLRRVGLDELIAHDEEEYIEKAVRLVNDDDYREGLSEHLRATDLTKCLFEDNATRYFPKAIDYLIANHERLQREGNREPILIT